MAEHYRCAPSLIWAMPIDEFITAQQYSSFKGEYEAAAIELNKAT